MTPENKKYLKGMIAWLIREKINSADMLGHIEIVMERELESFANHWNSKINDDMNCAMDVYDINEYLKEQKEKNNENL